MDLLRRLVRCWAVAVILVGGACLGGEPDWAGAMRKAHAAFSGKPGTIAQYGDSISYTKAFLSPLYYGNYKGELDIKGLQKRLLRDCAEWKGTEHGNYSGWRIDNCLPILDELLKKHNPEVAVIMFGTNDLNGGPPEKTGYEGKLDTFVQKCLGKGTVPVLTTIPPKRGTELYRDYNAAIKRVAAKHSVPVIDYCAEILKRRPVDCFGTLIDKDGVHPSYPTEYQFDFTEAGLKNSGYTLRNYLTARMWLDLNTYVLKR